MPHKLIFNVILDRSFESSCHFKSYFIHLKEDFLRFHFDNFLRLEAGCKGTLNGRRCNIQLKSLNRSCNQSLELFCGRQKAILYMDHIIERFYFNILIHFNIYINKVLKKKGSNNSNGSGTYQHQKQYPLL